MKNYISELISSTENDLKHKAKLSAEEVSDIAREVAEDEGWLPKYIQKLPCIREERGKLFWIVGFNLETKDGFLIIGSNKSLIIDDETGKLVNKIIGKR